MARTLEVSRPEMVLIVGTRVLLGLGIGLLVAARMEPRVRRRVGWTMFLVGVGTTLPLASTLMRDRTHAMRTTHAATVSASALSSDAVLVSP